MSAGWQIGDLAVCVNASNYGLQGVFGHLLTEGKVYKVLRLTTPPRWLHGEAGLGLVIDGPKNKNPEGDWFEGRFRKVEKDTQAANADDAAWLKDLLTKPVKVGESA